MRPVGRALEFCAQYGRWGLALGLVAGLLLPGVAAAMRPWLPQMVAGLLVITAMRVGFRAAVGTVGLLPWTICEVLALQLALPILAFGLLWVVGLSHTIVALALVLMMSAPSISGSSNFAAILGHDPTPAMQVLVTGTLIFPLTSLPLIWALSSQVAGFDIGIGASLRMIAVILGAVGLGFAIRAAVLRGPTPSQMRQLDGLGVIALSVVVIGLMTGIRPLLDQSIWQVLGWLALACAANFSLQLGFYAISGRIIPTQRRVPLSLVAGNRNVALFLLAFPDPIATALLPFIGCYQIPMYLTPLVMGRLYRNKQTLSG